ncbi:MAG: phage portal protein [Thermoguttaceae bacterium]
MSQPRHLLEAFDELLAAFLDPSELYCDSDGARWIALGGLGSSVPAVPFRNERDLAEIRAQCRQLAVCNEFAINGHENRISYVVGSGHTYRAVAKAETAPGQLVGMVQSFLDEFLRLNRWHQRQQEIVRRRDRDGEAFLRLFVDRDGMTRVRFIEPEQIAAPPGSEDQPATTFGIRTDPGDVETVVAYCVDGTWTGADRIQHRKANVDANVKRGLPLFYPVRKNLERAEKLLRNMSTVAGVQSAIAIIRKHAAGARGNIKEFANSMADQTRTDPLTGQTVHLRNYAPGTVLDSFAGTDYEFPVAGINAARYVEVLQAELRAVAARLVMPEFMLSSNASNANYASTMVAEGPAVRMFERLQHDLITDDLDLLDRVLGKAVRAGRLPAETLASVSVQATPPSLAVRDRLREVEADRILVRSGAMTAEMMARRHGLEPTPNSHPE